jgi:hypothetical protein
MAFSGSAAARAWWITHASGALVKRWLGDVSVTLATGIPPSKESDKPVMKERHPGGGPVPGGLAICRVSTSAAILPLDRLTTGKTPA